MFLGFAGKRNDSFEISDNGLPLTKTELSLNGGICALEIVV